VEYDIIPFCKEQGIGVIAYSPLMQGILTGRWKTADEVRLEMMRLG
jgi:aryl-alcohol dehydrogenase-like predicted oxidoreductase